jgi:hypothetical protein
MIQTIQNLIPVTPISSTVRLYPTPARNKR